MRKRYYRRNLPHYHPDDAPYFITWRLKDSIPKSVLEELKSQRDRDLALLAKDVAPDELSTQKIHKRFFAKYDNILDAGESGPHWLREPEVAAVLKQMLLEMHEKEIYLVAFCIMSNHVHAVFELYEDSPPLNKVMQLIKGRSARKCNLILRRTGEFWQQESYDHVVRDGELGRVVFYTINNPVKAGIVEEWEDYPFSYLDPGFLGFRKAEKFFG